jgi:hypothetical protein
MRTNARGVIDFIKLVIPMPQIPLNSLHVKMILKLAPSNIPVAINDNMDS